MEVLIDKKDEKHYNIYQWIMKKFIICWYETSRPFSAAAKLKSGKTTFVRPVWSRYGNIWRPGRRPFLYNIEIKSEPATDGIYQPAPAEFVELLAAVIKQYQRTEVIIQSFDFRPCNTCMNIIIPTLKLVMLIAGDDKRSPWWTTGSRLQAWNIQSGPRTVTPGTGRCMPQQRDKIIPWTVNDKGHRQTETNGVDGIITDYPNLFLIFFRETLHNLIGPFSYPNIFNFSNWAHFQKHNSTFPSSKAISNKEQGMMNLSKQLENGCISKFSLSYRIPTL